MKKLLIVVDYQNDFVDGSLGFDGAERLCDKIISKIKFYEENGYDIVYTLDTHGENYLATAEGKALPVEHCIKGTKGWELYDGLKEMLEGKICFEKETFGSKELFLYLLDKSYDEIELVGLVSNICVISNAVIAKSAQPEAQIIVDRSCTDSFSKELNQKCFDVMEGLQIKLI